MTTENKTAEIIVGNLTRRYHYAHSGGCLVSRKAYKTFNGAVRGAQKRGFTVVTTTDPMPAFLADDKRTKIVTVMGTDKLARIGVNTPLCCDPSSETYWSM
jgi:hypothetical protein